MHLILARPAHGDLRLQQRLEQANFCVSQLSVVDIVQIAPDDAQCAQFQANLATIDALVLTSSQGVLGLVAWLEVTKLSLPSRIVCFAVGKATQIAIGRYLQRLALLAHKGTSAGLPAAIQAQYARGKVRLGWPHGQLARSDWLAHLPERFEILTWLVYRTQLPQPVAGGHMALAPQLRYTQPVQAIVFTSPSGLQGWLTRYGPIPAHWAIFALGNTTGTAVVRSGLPLAGCAEPPNADGLIALIKSRLRPPQPMR